MENKAWKIQLLSNNRPYFVPHNLSHFAGKFECNPMGDGWYPPPAKLVNKAKPVPDFISWMTRAPLVTEKAMQVIASIAPTDVEFLDFWPVRNQKTFVLNVLTCVDALDKPTSNYDDDQFVLDEDKLVGAPDIFKCRGAWNDIFVTETFARAAVENSLSGIGLLRPERPTLHLIASGQQLNEYPGLGS